MARRFGWVWGLGAGLFSVALMGCSKRGAEPSSPAEKALPAATEPAAEAPMQPGYAQPPAADESPQGDADGNVSSGNERDRYESADEAAAALERDKLALDQALSNAQQLASGTACHNACAALGSMRRSVDALCGLAGDDDSRCQDARGVLESSQRRVDDAGCRC